MNFLQNPDKHMKKCKMSLKKSLQKVRNTLPNSTKKRQVKRDASTETSTSRNKNLEELMDKTNQSMKFYIAKCLAREGKKIDEK